MTEISTEANAVAALAELAVDPRELDPSLVYGVALRAGSEYRLLDLDRYLDRPRRKTGTYQPATVGALIDYVTLHRTDGTTLWVDKNSSRITAIINDHAADGAGFGGHRAVLQLQPSPEWKHWSSRDGQWLDQEAFAEHLQDGIEEIRFPDAATMLEVVQTIQGVTKADWKTATRLDNGEVSFGYHEEISATAGRKGHLEIPPVFELGVSPFYGEVPYAVTARLRYRIRTGTLSLGYKLVRPHDVVMDVLGAISTRLSEDAGFANVYLGAPPA